MQWRLLAMPSDRGTALAALTSFVEALAIVTLLSAPTFSTSQVGDRLILDNDTLSLCTLPLESYLDRLGRRPAVAIGNLENTANWRGYVATWKIEHSALWLVKVEKEYWRGQMPYKDHNWDTEIRVIPIDSFFPGQSAPVFAWWYTGTLRIPEGELLHHVHMGFASLTERDRFYTVYKGMVTGCSVVDNRVPESFRCEEDIARCGPDRRLVDTGNWLDARLLHASFAHRFNAYGSTITTRGHFVCDADEDALYLPWTPMTDQVWMPVVRLPLGFKRVDGLPVEVVVKLAGLPDLPVLKVLRIRALHPDESIYSQTFPMLYWFLDSEYDLWN
jgi:hypothetical protein